jgi:hypothetical protein
MGVDATGRAKYRKGELRLVLGLPEPWSEPQRDDFLKAVEALSRNVGVAPGDVHIQSALLTSWNPSDEQPDGVVTSADVEKLIIKFGLDEPRMRIESFEKGYALGKTQGAEIERERIQRALDDGYGQDTSATKTVVGADIRLPDSKKIVDVQLPEFNLAPLTDEEVDGLLFPPTEVDLQPAPAGAIVHTCTNCAKTLDVCNKEGCGGKVAPGFRWRLATTKAQEFATAADPALKPVPTVQPANPHGPGSPDASEPEMCANDQCLIRHSISTQHVWGIDEIDQLRASGVLCDDGMCYDFHYTDDGSVHKFSSAKTLSQEGW